MNNAGKVFFSQITSNLFSVLITVYFAHILSKTDFATLAVFSILCTLSSVVTSFGFEATAIQKIPSLISEKKDVEASAILKTTILNRAALSTVLAFFIYFGSQEISGIFLKTDEYQSIIKIMSIGIIFFSLNDSLDLLTQTTQQYGKISIVRASITVFSRVASLFLYSFLGLSGFILGLAWGPFVGNIAYLWILKNRLFLKSGFYPFIKLAKYSLPFYGRGYVRFGLMQFDQLIVGLFLQPAALSTYFVAKRLSDYIFMVSNAIGEPIRIKLSELKKNSPDNLTNIFSRISRYYSFIFVPLCTGISATSLYLLHLYGGVKYTSAAPVLILLSTGMLIYCFMGIYSMNIFVLGKPKEIFKLDMFGGFINSVSAIGLIFLFDITGIALAKLIAFFVSLIYAMYLLRNMFPANFDVKALGDSIIASIFMAGIVVLGQLIYYEILLIPVYVISGFAVYLLILGRKLERQDIELLQAFLPGRSKALVRVFSWFSVQKQGIPYKR